MTDRRQLELEMAKRDEAISNLAELRKEFLSIIRRKLRRLYLVRAAISGPYAYVTADDAREICEAIPGIPSPSVLNRNFLGATFKTSESFIYLPVIIKGN